MNNLQSQNKYIDSIKIADNATVDLELHATTLCVNFSETYTSNIYTLKIISIIYNGERLYRQCSYDKQNK